MEAGTSGTDEINMLNRLNQITSMGSSPIFQNEKDATPRAKFAVKIIRARDLEYQKVALREYSLLKTLNHPGIIKMVDAYVNNARETIYLVMDLV